VLCCLSANDDDGGHNVYRCVSFRLYYIVPYRLVDTSWGCAFGAGGPGKCSRRRVDGLVVERETTTMMTEAITATTVCRFGCIVSHWLMDTSWGCTFGVGRPGERVPTDESEGSEVDLDVDSSR
jgi:hypothetical protein